MLLAPTSGTKQVGSSLLTWSEGVVGLFSDGAVGLFGEGVGGLGLMLHQ